MNIHPKLIEDTKYLGKLELSHCLLMNDSRYPWIILVPDVDDAEEIYQLTEEQSVLLMNESCLIQQLIVDLFHPDKLNLGALGNIVPQLHLHHIARESGDPAWPGPVWGHSPAIPYSIKKLEKTINLIKNSIELTEQ
ncbi:MAG: HIT family protein [Gammaproteobacteria bacterium]|uniref:HIT family protein n=1 Tax=Candidatus Thiopontia autotrophica TaxID=2841688 RepID=A0A8J6PAR1_9GAMM|nr:HIT family protein [Candidatus Thiopontia autotrophica]MBL6968936.1 HIT family protein [Gammaproteobacteria bacterium]